MPRERNFGRSSEREVGQGWSKSRREEESPRDIYCIGLKAVYLNARSAMNKFGELQAAVCIERPDVLIVDCADC